MLKSKYLFLYLIAVLFILLNVFIFVTPFDKYTSFWITYAFTVVGFFPLIVIWYLNFSNERTKSNIFRKYPLIYSSITYCFLQFFLLFFIIFQSTLEVWIVALLNSFLFGVYIFIIIMLVISKNTIEAIDIENNSIITSWNKMRFDLEEAILKERNIETRGELNRIVEELKYTDPRVMTDGEFVSNIKKFIQDLNDGECNSEHIREFDTKLKKQIKIERERK